MKIKKLVTAVSALAIAASAFAGLAVTANAATKTLYGQNFEELTTDTLENVLRADEGATYGSTVTVETDSTSTKFLKMYSGNNNRDTAATFKFDKEVTDSNVTLNFRTQLSTGSYYSTGGNRTSKASIYVLPSGKAVTPSKNAAPTDYLFTLSALATSDANKKLTSRSLILTTGSGDSTLFLSDSDDTTTDVDGTAYGNITMTSGGSPTTSWINVKADIDFTAGTAAISINNVSLGTLNLASEITGISGIAYQGGGKNYGYAAIDDILATKEVDESGYIINTTPYSRIVIDGTTTVNSGKSGVYTFEPGTTGKKTVVISKNGYTTRTETITFADSEEGTYTLTPNTGYSYFEDFTNVNDGNFGFDAGVSVANGTLSISNKGTNSSTDIPSVDVSGKAIHIVTQSLNASNNNYGYLKFDGTDLSLYYYNKQIRLHGASGGKTDWVDATNAVDIDIVINSGNTAATLYVNGVNTGEYVNTNTKTLTGLSTAHGKGTFAANVSELAVVDTHKVTIVDDESKNATTYAYGSKVTLPEAAGKDGYEFKGWSDGTNTVAAGTEVTVSADVTYTAVYVKNAEASPLTTVQDPWTNNDGKWAEAFKFTVTPNDQTVTKVIVSVGDKSQEKEFKGGVSGEGFVTFGIIATADSEANLPAASAFTVKLN